MTNLNANVLKNYRSELQVFLNVFGDFEGQNKEKSLDEIRVQKLKLAVYFKRLLAISHEKDAEVWREVGTAYFFGYCGVKNVEQAEAWYQSAANAGDAKAMMGLAHCLRAGGEKANLTEAVEWYRKAAELGNISALKYLARAYASGRGFKKDIDRGTELMLRNYRSSEREDDIN